MWQFYAAVETRSPTTRDIVLRELDRYHGGTFKLPTSALVIDCICDPVGILRAADLMETEFPIANTRRRISVVSGSVYFLVLLTRELLRRGVEPRQLLVRLLRVQAAQLTPPLRRELAEAWECQIVEAYSLTEIYGSAMHCFSCGRYRYEPVVHCEYLDPISRLPVEQGLAVLVISELFPFVSHEPLIRYWTDDLVVLNRDSCPACGDSGFVPMGRLPLSVRTAESIVLPQLDWLQVLSEDQWVQWRQRGTWMQELYGRLPMDRPNLTINLLPDGVLRMSGIEGGPVPPSEVTERLTTALLAKSQCLRDACERGDVTAIG
jgi:hypothetical protein